MLTPVFIRFIAAVAVAVAAMACSPSKPAPAADAGGGAAAPAGAAAADAAAAPASGPGERVVPAPQFAKHSPLPSHPPDGSYDTRGADDPEALIRSFHTAAASGDAAAARDLLLSYATCEATPAARLQEVCRRAVREIHNAKLPQLMAQARAAGAPVTVEVTQRKEHPKGAALQLKVTYAATAAGGGAAPGAGADADVAGAGAGAGEAASPPTEQTWLAVIYEGRAYLSARIDDPTTVAVAGNEDATTIIRAQQQVGKLSQLSMIFQGKEGRAPKDINEMAAMLKTHLNIDVQTVDPWGSSLSVTVGPNGMAVIASPGPDKLLGTADDVSSTPSPGGHGGHGGHDGHDHH